MKMLSATYIQMHFRLVFTMANDSIGALLRLHPWEQSDLGPYCFQMRLSENIADKRANDKNCD